MAIHNSLKSGFRRFASLLRKTSKNTRRRGSRRITAPEQLEQRQLLAGVVMDESVFNVDQFEQNIRDYFVDNSVGFAYAINQGGVNVASDGWGDARRPIDGQVDWTAGTRMTTASVSKPITATGIIKILQDTQGVGLDSSISPYLPAAWVQGPNIASITFRELLTHDSGLRDGNAGVGNNPRSYAGLQQIISTGVTLAAKNQFSYENSNFALMRVMTPYLLGDGAAADNAANPAQFTADAYVDYIQANVLAPMGIVANTAPPAVNPTLVYPLPGNAPGVAINDQTLLSGSRGWWLSANQLALFLHGVHTNDSVLSEPVRNMMFDGFLGWMNPGLNDGNYGFSQGMFGTYYSHTGDQGLVNTAIMDFPNGVQAALLINSNFTNAPYQGTALKIAFEDAWPELVYDGYSLADVANVANLISSADDTFTVRTNPIDPAFIDIVHQAIGIFGTTITVATITRRADTLQKLTINGLSGNDTLQILDLPNGMELDVIFNGGSGDDLVTVNDLPNGVEFTFNGQIGNDTVNVARADFGSILTVNGGDGDDVVNFGTTGDLDDVRTVFVFVGGSGSDSLFVNDLNDSSPQLTHAGFHREYVVRQTRIDRSHSGIVGQFSQLENVTLDASNQTSLIRLLSTTNFTNLQLNGNQGDDRIVLGSGLAATQLNSIVRVSTGSGDDTLIIDDRNSQFANENYVLQGDHFQSQSIPLVFWGDGTPPEQIRLRQNQVGTTTNIRNVLSGVRVDVEGNAGDDTINVHATEAGSLLFVGGGERDDVINITPESQNADNIQGMVYAYGGSGTDRVILHDQANTDADGRNYRVLGYSIDVVGSPFGKLFVPSSSQTEFVEIRGGIEDDVFDVRTWSNTAELQLHGNLGDDQLRVAASARTVDAINGHLVYYADTLLSLPGTPSPGHDTAVVHDDQRIGSPNYEFDIANLQAQLLTTNFRLTSFGAEEITLNANGENNRVDVFGTASSLHTADYILNVGGGKDTINVYAPVSATVFANGGSGNDAARVHGTNNDDVVTLQGDRMDVREVGSLAYSTSVVRDADIVAFRIDANGGLDVLNVVGQSGINESIVVQASIVAGSGSVTASPFRQVTFVELEDVDVDGNAHDQDSLTFLATNQNDSLSINPVGAGTTLQPFVQLTSAGGVSLLKLRDATHVGRPVISGMGGSDTFRVTIDPNPAGNPVRSMQLDAGESLNDHDQLIVNYNSNAWPLIQPATNHHSGTLLFGNGQDLLGILFSNFEELVGDLF